VFHLESPLNIVLCENFPVCGDALSELRSTINLLLCEESRELRHYFEINVGLVPAINEAIVPQIEADFSIAIPVEAERAPLYIDATEWKCGSVRELPNWPGVQFRKPFDPLHQRKLLVHNMAHAIIGYLGFYAGYNGMSEAVLDQEIRDLVQNSASSVAHALYNDWLYSDTQHPGESQYVAWLFDRYDNPELGDQVVRVCRDPIRKLEQFDRLVGAINHVVAHALNSDIATLAASMRGILVGVAAAMRYAVDTQATSKAYSELREQVIARLSLDSRYLEDAERAFEEFRKRRSPSLVQGRKFPGDGLIEGEQ
jgi:mannitol-1-phosphate 5-dehydrogenase